MRRQQGVRQRGLLSVLAVVAVTLVLGAVPAWAANFKPQIFLEFNFTDNDLGVQVFLDAAAWQVLTITDTDGNVILQMNATGALGELGLTELRWESDEPSPQEVLEKFPPGGYHFEVTLVGGGVLNGTDTLSHDLPTEVTIVSPEEDGSLDPDNAVISWTHPNPSQLAGFEVIVENVTSGVPVATYTLSAAATTVQVPAEAFAGPGNKYKVEVLAIHKTNGNKTIVEHTFTTE